MIRPFFTVEIHLAVRNASRIKVMCLEPAQAHRELICLEEGFQHREAAMI